MIKRGGRAVSRLSMVTDDLLSVAEIHLFVCGTHGPGCDLDVELDEDAAAREVVVTVRCGALADIARVHASAVGQGNDASAVLTHLGMPFVPQPSVSGRFGARSDFWRLLSWEGGDDFADAVCAFCDASSDPEQEARAVEAIVRMRAPGDQQAALAVKPYVEARLAVPARYTVESWSLALAQQVRLTSGSTAPPRTQPPGRPPARR